MTSTFHQSVILWGEVRYCCGSKTFIFLISPSPVSFPGKSIHFLSINLAYFTVRIPRKSFMTASAPSAMQKTHSQTHNWLFICWREGVARWNLSRIRISILVFLSNWEGKHYSKAQLNRSNSVEFHLYEYSHYNYMTLRQGKRVHQITDSLFLNPLVLTNCNHLN